MTLISSGALGLKDAGTNPASNVLLDTGYNSLSLGSDSSFGMFRRIFESEPGYSAYFSQQVVDGTAYYYRRNSTGASHKGYVSSNNSSGYNASIFTTAYTYMAASPGFGDWSSNDLAINSSTASSVGSLSNSTYVDASGTNRQINDFGLIKNTNNYSGGSWTQDRGNLIWFSLDGQVTNNNLAFYQITAYDNNGNGITVTRSGASYDYDGVQSVWTWHNNSDAIMDYGNVLTSATRLYITRSGTTSFNNGISEEMSGGSDTNPIEFSDYYKDGTYHNTAGIPTSGQIEFSDFYGKVRDGTGGTNIHETAWVGEFNWNYVSFSGYNSPTSLGSMTDTTFTYPSTSTTATIYTLYNINNQNSFLTLSGAQFADSGWTNLKIWVNNSTGSGSPTYTLTRSSGTRSVNTGTSPHQTTWTWGVAHAYSTTSVGGTYNNYMVID